MASHYWFVGPLEAFLDRLPHAIARPITSVIVILYFNWKLLLGMCLMVSVIEILGFLLWDELPVGEAIPAIFLLTLLAVFSVWQWDEANRLRARLRSLEDELREEDTEYDTPEGDAGRSGAGPG